MKLNIFVGTASDNALYVAQAVQAALASELEVIEVHVAGVQSQAELFELGPDEAALVITSTHGNGEVPENLQPLYADLDQRPRYLGSLRYGVIALGDSFYGDTFAAGGKLFDARLQDLGAQRIGEMLILDASEDADGEAIAAEWARAWVKHLG